MDVVTRLALALAFAGVCAGIYLLLARGRQNVRRDALLIFASIFVFALIRVLLG